MIKKTTALRPATGGPHLHIGFGRGYDFVFGRARGRLTDSAFLINRYAIVTRSRATATTAPLWVWRFRSRRKNAPIRPGCVAACWAPA